MAKIETRDELLRELLYESKLSHTVQTGVKGDTRVDNFMSEGLEQEVREVLND